MASILPSITQNPDIRFLGKALGDVIRAYGGERLFERTEHIRADQRRTPPRRRRGAGGGPWAGDAEPGRDARFRPRLHAVLDARQPCRGSAGRSAESDADIAHALARLKELGVGMAEITKLLDHALIAPVLTAHPTEVRRKSQIDHKQPHRRADDSSRMRAPAKPRRATASMRRSCARSRCFGRPACCAASGSM